jgi:hypothetical protein
MNDLKHITAPDDTYGFFEFAYEQGWTDGLPVIPPTEFLIEQFVKAAGRKPDEEIAEIEPRKGVATVEKIAANAIMAGCKPNYMQTLIAIVQAIVQPPFNLGGIQTTTNPVAPLIIVNGNIRGKLEMNMGRNALGPGNRANATIGRALRLILLNIGGAYPGKVDKATLGMPGKYTFCLAENEEESPWEPLSVELGYKKDENVVSIVGAQGTSNVITGEKDSKSQLDLLADCMSVIGNNNFMSGKGNPCVLLSPGHAKVMAREGWTKSSIKEYLFEKSHRKFEEFPKDLFPGHPRNIRNGCAYVCDQPDDILIVVVGGPEPYHIQYAPNFGVTSLVTQSFLV